MSHTDKECNEWADTAAVAGRKAASIPTIKEDHSCIPSLKWNGTEPQEVTLAHVENVCDWAEHVEIWTLETTTQTTIEKGEKTYTEVTKKRLLYQLKDINRTVRDQQWFIGGKASEWRERLGIVGEDKAEVVPIPRGVVHPNKYWWPTWLRLCYKQLFTPNSSEPISQGS